MRKLYLIPHFLFCKKKNYAMFIKKNHANYEKKTFCKHSSNKCLKILLKIHLHLILRYIFDGFLCTPHKSKIVARASSSPDSKYVVVISYENDPLDKENTAYELYNYILVRKACVYKTHMGIMLLSLILSALYYSKILKETS